MDRGRPPAAVTGRHHGTKIPGIVLARSEGRENDGQHLSGLRATAAGCLPTAALYALLNLFATPAAAETLDFSTRYSVFC